MDSMEDGHSPVTRSDFEGLRNDFGIVRADVENLRTEVGGLRTEVGGLRTEVGGLRTEVGSLRTEVKADIESLRGETARLNSSVRRLAIDNIDVRDELRELKGVVATKADIKHLVDAVESFAGKTQSYEAAKTLHGQVLTDVQVQIKDHERRIKGLEDGSH